MNTILHHHKALRIGTAGITSIFIVLHGRWDQVIEALAAPSFYLALAISFSIAILLLSYIHYSNRFLNQRYPWKENMIYRGLLQLIVGVVIPAALDLLLIGIYLNAIGQDMRTNGFLQFDFPVIVFFLFAINCIYVILPLIGGTVNVDAEEAPPEEYIMTVTHGGTYVHLNVNEDILCLIKEGKYITVLTAIGDEYQLQDTMSTIQERFRDSNLCRINRSAFVNLQCIIGYRNGDKPRTLEILLKPVYRELIPPHRRDFLVVTGVHVPIIRELFTVS